MPPASAQNRPPLYVNLAGGRQYEYRPNIVNGVLQWVLRPVYTLAYFIQRLIRRARAASNFLDYGYHVRTQDGGEDLFGEGNMPYMVDLQMPRLPPEFWRRD